MKKNEPAATLWASLADIPVVGGPRASLGDRFPGELDRYEVYPVRALGAFLLVPRRIDRVRASLPIPIWELCRRGDGEFAFATSEGFDLYRISSHRLVGYRFVDKLSAGTEPVAPVGRRSPQLTARALRRRRRAQRSFGALCAGIALAVTVVSFSPLHHESPPMVPTRDLESAAPAPLQSTTAVVGTARALLDHLAEIDPGLRMRRMRAQEGSFSLEAVSPLPPDNAIALFAATASLDALVRLAPRTNGGTVLEVRMEDLRSQNIPPDVSGTPGPPPLEDAPHQGAVLLESIREPPPGHTRERWEVDTAIAFAILQNLHRTSDIRSVSLEALPSGRWLFDVRCGDPPSIPVSLPEPGAPPIPRWMSPGRWPGSGPESQPPAIPPPAPGGRSNGFLRDSSGRLFIWRRARGYLELEEAG